MDIIVLMQSGSGLLVILIILILLLFWSSKIKKSKKVKKTKQIKKSKPVVTSKKLNTDLKYLTAIVKKRKSTNEELQEALELIIKYHGTIKRKNGVNTHADFDIYMDIIFTICRHPNTSKEIILKFDRDLEKLNPSYIPEINTTITRGLNSRGM